MHPLSICVLFIPHILVRLLPMEYVEDSKFTPCNSRSTYTRLCRVRPVRLVLQDFIESILSEMILRDSVESVQSDLHYPTSPCSSQLGNSSCPAHSTGYPWNAPFGNPPHFRGPVERLRWRSRKRHFRHHRRQFSHCWGPGDLCRLFKSVNPGFYWRRVPAFVAIPLLASTTMPQRLPTTLAERPSFPQSISPPPPSRHQPFYLNRPSKTILPPPPPRPVNQPYAFYLSIMNYSGIFS